jgi:signal transduction histidine kinase
MSLRKVSVRIGLWYAIAFLLGAACLYAFTAYLLIDSLRKKDEHLLRVKLEEYAAMYEKEGATSLRTRTSSLTIPDAQNYIVRLGDAKGSTVFLHAPDRSDDSDALTLSEIESGLSADGGKSPWLLLKASEFGDDVEVVSMRLSGGEVLQVGKDTEDREEFLDSFSSAFLGGSVPVLILALCTGVLLSNRLLAPLRALSQTMENIRRGHSSARVPLHRTDDELRRLGVLFNSLQEDNERLINGMRDTVNNVAHDLRTPLTGLMNAIEHAISGEQNVAAFRAALEDCYESGESIRILLNGIMDIAEAEAGTLRLRKQRIALSSVAEQAIDLYALVAEERHIALVREGDSQVFVEVDPVRLLQAASNLLDNAIKYSPPGTSVFVRYGVEGNSAVLSIQDQGQGVSAEIQDRIWDRLFRGDTSRSTRGLGLGLSLVKAIVTAHGGLARNRTAPAGGSVFEIILPLSANSITAL